MEQLTRLQSGIKGLDALLKGGLVAGASYIVQGRPGSGKTILANQIAFNHVNQGGRALVVTLLSETHERLFQFLSTLSFFAKENVGAEIQFVSAFDTLQNDGLEEVVKLLRREISRQKATVLIVDGLLNARSKAESQLDTKKFISELQGHAAFAGCTVLFLTSSRLDDGSPEHTMVDGIIELSEELAGTRAIKQIQLRKTRGSGALGGLHQYEITSDGVVVHPRIESLYGHPSRPDSASIPRISSGIESLDRVISGGLPCSSVSLVTGPSGSGKTSVGLRFLSQSTPEAPGLHFGFYETPERLRLKARSIGIDLPALESAGALRILWQPTTEGILDAVGMRLLRAVEEHGIRRVFIDSLGGMARLARNSYELCEFYSALMNELRARQVTVHATWEMRGIFGPEIDSPVPELSSMVDNLLMMRFVELEGELKRVLSILKMRDSSYDPSLFEISISDSGIRLDKAFKHATAVMSGTAAPLPNN